MFVILRLTRVWRVRTELLLQVLGEFLALDLFGGSRIRITMLNEVWVTVLMCLYLEVSVFLLV
jgi:hypothetical protein